MTMREKIAKALFTEIARNSGGRVGNKQYWETAPKEVKDFCYSLTGAALVAVHEPTEAMIAAGDDVAPVDIFAHEKASRLRYQAMIDAAWESE